MEPRRLGLWCWSSLVTALLLVKRCVGFIYCRDSRAFAAALADIFSMFKFL